MCMLACHLVIDTIFYVIRKRMRQKNEVLIACFFCKTNFFQIFSYIFEKRLKTQQNDFHKKIKSIINK